MSINDELMWKYWTFLTDLPQSQMDAMRASVAAGQLHPMQAKKDLAHSITADFHTAAEADAAAESWSTQFQQKGVADDVEQVAVALTEVARLDLISLELAQAKGNAAVPIDLAKLLVCLKIKESRRSAETQITNAGIFVDGIKTQNVLHTVAIPPGTLTIRSGRQTKIAILT
jgi:tyrosyl-tRNA synthetase